MPLTQYTLKAGQKLSVNTGTAPTEDGYYLMTGVIVRVFDQRAGGEVAFELDKRDPFQGFNIFSFADIQIPRKQAKV